MGRADTVFAMTRPHHFVGQRQGRILVLSPYTRTQRWFAGLAVGVLGGAGIAQTIDYHLGTGRFEGGQVAGPLFLVIGMTALILTIGRDKYLHLEERERTEFDFKHLNTLLKSVSCADAKSDADVGAAGIHLLEASADEKAVAQREFYNVMLFVSARVQKAYRLEQVADRW